MLKLLNNALSYLRRYCPTDYFEWAVLKEYGPPEFNYKHVTGVVNIARLTDQVDLLLMVLLTICCTIARADRVARGFKRLDGSRERLSQDNIKLCSAAKSRLLYSSARAARQICQPLASDMHTGTTPSRGVRKFGKAPLQDLEDSAVNSSLSICAHVSCRKATRG